MEHVGIDVHAGESQICSLTAEGEILERRIRTRRDGVKSGPRRRSRIWNRIEVLPLRRSPQKTSSPPWSESWKRLRTSSNSASRPKKMDRSRTRFPTMKG